MSGSLQLIDENRVNDEPVLGWSSGLPAPVSTPSNDGAGGYLTVDTASPMPATNRSPLLGSGNTWSSSNTWTRVPTPNPSMANPSFSPALTPLEAVQEHGQGEIRIMPSRESTGEIRIMKSRDANRKSLNSAGSQLDTLIARGSTAMGRGKTGSSRGTTGDAAREADSNSLGGWESQEREESPVRVGESSTPPASPRSMRRRAVREKGTELPQMPPPLSRTPSIERFDQEQDKFRGRFTFSNVSFLLLLPPPRLLMLS
jgi:hypothetical protein